MTRRPPLRRAALVLPWAFGLSLASGADHTPPDVTVEPGPGWMVADATPRLVVRYRDPVGPGETAASGVEVDSLRVEVDDVDRTALFTHRSDEAAADWPPDQPLAEGVHRLRATMRDRAGNAGSAASQFRVDLTRPALAIVEPPGGAYLPTRTPALR